MELFGMCLPPRSDILQAIKALESVYQEVLKRRFGFHGDAAMSYKEIALYLSTILTAEQRQHYMSCLDKNRANGQLCEKDVQNIEARALRELYKKKKIA